MSIQIPGYFPALIIGEVSFTAGLTLSNLASPYLEKYPSCEKFGKIIINFTGGLLTACLLGYAASVPLSVAMAVNVIACGVFLACQSQPRPLLATKEDLKNSYADIKKHCLSKKDLINFLTNLRQIPHIREQFLKFDNSNLLESDYDSETEILIPE